MTSLSCTEKNTCHPRIYNPEKPSKMKREDFFRKRKNEPKGIVEMQAGIKPMKRIILN
jgi:hypothetical protein